MNDQASVFMEHLQCAVIAVKYEPFRLTGTLTMEDGCCCDMSGCIAMFEAIDPMVRKIETWRVPTGAIRDTTYRKKENGRWTAEFPPF